MRDLGNMINKTGDRDIQRKRDKRNIHLFEDNALGM